MNISIYSELEKAKAKGTVVEGKEVVFLGLSSLQRRVAERLGIISVYPVIVMSLHARIYEVVEFVNFQEVRK
jgi:hypothetical protein